MWKRSIDKISISWRILTLWTFIYFIFFMPKAFRKFNFCSTWIFECTLKKLIVFKDFLLHNCTHVFQYLFWIVMTVLNKYNFIDNWKIEKILYENYFSTAFSVWIFAKYFTEILSYFWFNLHLTKNSKGYFCSLRVQEVEVCVPIIPIHSYCFQA